MTDKMISIILILCFITSNAISLWHIFTVEYPSKILEVNPFNIALGVLELSFMCLTGILYLYMLLYIRRTSKIMESKRSGNQQSYCDRVTHTIMFVFICLLTCNLTQFVGMIYVILSTSNDKVLVRNTIFWTLLALYLNSFFNAIILLIRRNHQKRDKRVPAAPMANYRNTKEEGKKKPFLSVIPVKLDRSKEKRDNVKYCPHVNGCTIKEAENFEMTVQMSFLL